MKDELQATKISITCYDKDGNIVKRVTSADSNDVEDPEQENNGNSSNSGNNGGNSGSGSGSETPGGNSGNSGSSSETPIVAAPTISGTTPFADTTQVTLTEPEGARVYYTTDGSTPTSESTLYTEPFTLSATTTVKAIAIKDETASEVASKTFTKSSGGSDTE